MADKFDPYREALVMEQVTHWGDTFDDLDESERERLARLLHDTPEKASELVYQRTHTGFCRVITVTEEDIQRLKTTSS
jgi:DNA anti-recombination protein RmuC